MNNSRTSNSIRNINSAFINRLFLIILPFIARTILVKTLGSDYLGLNGLFTSLLTVLNLSELGFGSALVYCMYKPIAQNDKDHIKALLGLYKIIYQKIGLSILTIGILLTPVLPYLVKNSYPSDINLYYLYFIYLLNATISYFAYAYKQALLIAYQRKDITTNINTLTSIILYILQILSLIFTKDYYVYVWLYPIFTVINNVITGYYAYKYYPDITPSGEVKKEEIVQIKTHVKGLAIQRLCSTSRNAFDSIAISMFLGLTSIAIYNNYYAIMNAVHVFLYQIPEAIRSSVGNSIASESKEKNYELFNTINIGYCILSGICCSGLICLYQPFMLLWMGKDLLLPFHTVILFCLYFVLLSFGDTIALFKDGAGLWWQGRYRTIIESVSNLILNFVLGYYLGIDGIIIATIITVLFLGIGYGGYILFYYYFSEESYKLFLAKQLYLLLIIVIICSLSFYFCNQIQTNDWLGLAYKLLLCLFISISLFFMCFFRNQYFIKLKNKIKRII